MSEQQIHYNILCTLNDVGNDKNNKSEIVLLVVAGMHLKKDIKKESIRAFLKHAEYKNYNEVEIDIDSFDIYDKNCSYYRCYLVNIPDEDSIFFDHFFKGMNVKEVPPTVERKRTFELKSVYQN